MLEQERIAYCSKQQFNASKYQSMITNIYNMWSDYSIPAEIKKAKFGSTYHNVMKKISLPVHTRVMFKKQYQQFIEGLKASSNPK